MRWILLAGLLLGASIVPAMAKCDLGQLIGYTLVFSKTIDSYVEDGKRVHGFTGCTRDRVLVFSDGTGVRCKDTIVHDAQIPQAFLFAKTATDMKACIDDDLYDVAPAN